MASSLLVPIIRNANLPKRLDLALTVLKNPVRERLLRVDLKREELFMVARNIPIANLHPGTNQMEKLARSVKIPFWSRSGKRMKILLWSVPIADSRKPMLRLNWI